MIESTVARTAGAELTGAGGRPLKVAIAHDYLTQRGGAERVVLAMTRAFPEATVHTLLYDPETTFPEFGDVAIETSPIDRSAALRRHHRAALPLLPWASGRMRIDADVVLVSSSGWAHGFDIHADRTVVYCHAPARWLYQADDYLGDAPRLSAARLGLAAMAPGLRRWDQRRAQRADSYLANSRVVRDRIATTYGRDADVLPPPFGVDAEGEQRVLPALADWAGEGWDLVVSRLLPYKHVDHVLEAYATMPDRKLVVVGAGPEKARLQAMAPGNVRLVQDLTDAELRWVYARSHGLVAASHEDFGLTPLEAGAHGKPVVALRAGGYLDTVVDGLNGVFFDDVSPEAIAAAVRRRDRTPFSASAIRRHADRFSEEAFIARLRHAVGGGGGPPPPPPARGPAGTSRSGACAARVLSRRAPAAHRDADLRPVVLGRPFSGFTRQGRPRCRTVVPCRCDRTRPGGPRRRTGSNAWSPPRTPGAASRHHERMDVVTARVEVVRDLARAWTLADQWESLAEECDASPMVRPAYALSWWEHLGRGRLLVVGVFESDRLVALAPLHERRFGPVRIVRWLGHGLGTVAAALVSPEYPEAGRTLWSAAGARGRVLQLVESRYDGTGLAAAIELNTRRDRRVLVCPRDRCPTMPVLGDHLHHLAARHRKRMRKSVAKGKRRIADAGWTHRIEVAEDAATLAALMPDLREVWDASEAASPKQHFLQGEYEPFTLDLLRRGMERDQVTVLVGYVGDRPASTYVWLRSGTTMLGWVCRFHPALSEVGPGHLMLAAGYDFAAGRGYPLIDLGVGDSEYKASWTAEGYETVDVLAGPVLAVSILAPVLRRAERRERTRRASGAQVGAAVRVDAAGDADTAQECA